MIKRRDFITLLGGLGISALNIRIIVGRGEAVVPPLVHPKIAEEGRGRIEGWRTVEAHCATRRIAPPPHGEHSMSTGWQTHDGASWNLAERRRRSCCSIWSNRHTSPSAPSVAGRDQRRQRSKHRARFERGIKRNGDAPARSATAHESLDMIGTKKFIL